MSEADPALIDEYVAGFPNPARELLERFRAVVRETAPEATESISYGIPTFDLGGKHLVHYAGYARHVGFYPGSAAIVAFSEELSAFKTSKGTVQFPLDAPLPEDLVRAMVRYRVERVSAGA